MMANMANHCVNKSYIAFISSDENCNFFDSNMVDKEEYLIFGLDENRNVIYGTENIVTRLTFLLIMAVLY